MNNQNQNQNQNNQMYKKSFLNEIDFPLPKFVQDSEGICPNWILPLDQLSFGVEIE